MIALAMLFFNLIFIVLQTQSLVPVLLLMDGNKKHVLKKHVQMNMMKLKFVLKFFVMELLVSFELQSQKSNV